MTATPSTQEQSSRSMQRLDMRGEWVVAVAYKSWVLRSIPMTREHAEQVMDNHIRNDRVAWLEPHPHIDKGEARAAGPLPRPPGSAVGKD